MTNFALTTSSSPQAIIQSLNYALATAGSGNTLSVSGNAIVYNNGSAYSYLYQYLWVAYATNNTGTTGFSFSPTGATYYGVHSSGNSSPSSNPADYTWTQVAQGFGTTNFLWYITYGGGQINFVIAPTAPNSQYRQVQNGVAIDLYIVTAISANVANGAPGANGTTSTVSPSIVIFPQNTDSSYTPISEIITANFYANTGNVANIATANVYANVSSTGNVSYSIIYNDPTIDIIGISSNTYSSVTLDFFQTTSGVSTTAVAYVLTNGNTGANGANGTNGTNGNSGISSTYLTVYTQANVIPSTPLADTGAWNFGNVSQSYPPLDPNYQLAQYEYIQPSTITPHSSNVYLQYQTNSVAQTSNSVGYTFYTFSANTYMQGPDSAYYAGNFPQGQGLSSVAFTGNIVVSGATAYVDMLLIGSCGDGTSITQPGGEGDGWPLPGGSGGAVTIVSNVALDPGTYTIQLGRGGATSITYANVTTNMYHAIQGNTGTQNAAANIVAGSGGGINGAAGHAGGTFVPPLDNNQTPIDGGAGIADPWNQITWTGQIQGNGAAYFSGGGGASGFETSGPILYVRGGVGGIGGGGTGDFFNGITTTQATNGMYGSGGGGGTDTNNPAGGHGYNAYGAPGILIIRQHNPVSLSNGISTWSFANPGTTLLDEVFSSSALAITANNDPTGNVTNLTWSSPIVSTTIAPPSLSIQYPKGQYITNNQGVYTPTPVANVVTLTANIQAKRGNVILAAVEQDTLYFIANGGYSLTSNVTNQYNANAFVLSSPVTSQYNVYQNVSYTDIGGNVAGFVSEALLVTTQGNVGAAGFIPLAYIVCNVDPTTANVSTLNAMYAAPRTNTFPPIGVGLQPIDNDTAQFFYPNIAVAGGGVTSVQLYNGTNWGPVNAQVISGSVIYTGTITAEQMNVNEIYTLTLQSTNAINGNINSPGFWLDADTGSARFGGNTYIGNDLILGNNAVIGGNTVIGNSIKIGLNANIGGNAVVGDYLGIGNYLSVGNNAVIGQNLIVGNNAIIGDDLVVGNNTVIGGILSIGDNSRIGGNLTVGQNAYIGANLTIAGLVNGGQLSNNTVGTYNIVSNSVTNQQIAQYTITANNLSSSVTSQFGARPFGITIANASSYSLTNTSSYDYSAPVTGFAGNAYIKLLAWNEFIPTVGQANYGVEYKVYFSFDVVASGYPVGSTFLYLYQNSAAHGGNSTPAFNTSSSLLNIGPTGPDEATFSQSTYNGQVIFGAGNYTIEAGTNQLYTNQFDTIGLALVNGSGAGNIQISNITWSVAYP